MPEDQTKELINALKQTNELLSKGASLRFAFYRGLVGGFGGIIGATMLVALFVWIVSRLELIPILGSFVSQITDFVVQNSVLSDPRINP